MKLYQKYGEIQVQDRIELYQIMSKYKYRIGLKLHRRYEENTSKG